MRDFALFVGELGSAIKRSFSKDPRALFVQAAADAPADVRRMTRVLVVRSGPKVDRRLLDELPRLRWVVRAGSGTDNIDLAELDRRSIELLRVPGTSARAVGDLGLSALVLLARKVPLAQAHLYRGHWAKAESVGEPIHGLRVAIWGGGPIGLDVYERVKAAGCEAHFAAWPSLRPGLPHKHPRELEQHADVHFFCVPLREQTRGLAGTEFYARCAARAPYIVNLARFEILDWRATLLALDRHELRGVFVDPVDKRHVPEVCASLAAFGPLNLLMTPHLGAQRGDVMQLIARTVAEHVDALLAMTPNSSLDAGPQATVMP